MLSQVRSRTAYPVLNDFASGDGSPLIIDRDAGNLYLLQTGDQIVRVGGNARSLLDFMSPSQVSAVVNQTLNADVTTAVQKAFNSGEALFGPRGAYRLDGTVTIPSYADFTGSGNQTIFRQTGNAFAFSFTGDQCAVRNFQVDASVAQVGGGGAFDYTNAGSNIRMDDMYFGSNLYFGLYIAPAVANKGAYFFDRLRWNGVVGSHTAIRIGDDQHLVSDIYVSNVSGTASTVADMNTWLDIWNGVDTPLFTDCLFIKSTPTSAAIAVGTATATQGVTGAKFTNVVVDTVAGNGWGVARASDLEMENCSIQTCTDKGLYLAASSSVTGVRMRGGSVQGCGKTGILVFAGPTDIFLDGVRVANNNTTNTANTHGIEIANSQHVKVVNCTSGNLTYPAVAGHQKYGLMIDVDATDYYTVIGNDFTRNETGGLSDGGTGVNKFVSSNL